MEFQGRVATKGLTLSECLAAAVDLEADATDHVTIVQDGTEPDGVVGDLSGLAAFPALRMVRIFGPVDAASLASLHAVADRLQYVHCVGEVRIDDLRCVSGLTVLRRLALEQLHGLASLAGVEDLVSLDTLELAGPDVPCSDVTGAAKLVGLERVTLSGFTRLVDTAALEACASVDAFEIRGASSLERVPNIGRWTKLKALHIVGAPRLRDLDGIGAAAKLKTLEITDCPNLVVPSGVNRLTKLASLTVAGAPAVALPTLGAQSPLLRSVKFRADHLPVADGGTPPSTIDTVEISGGTVMDPAALHALVVGARKEVVLDHVIGGGDAALPAHARAQRLQVRGLTAASASFLSSFSNASYIRIEGTRVDADALAALASLPSLDHLVLEECTGFRDGAALAAASRMTRLDIRNCSDLDYDTVVVPAGTHLAGDTKAMARARALARAT